MGGWICSFTKGRTDSWGYLAAVTRGQSGGECAVILFRSTGASQLPLWGQQMQPLSDILSEDMLSVATCDENHIQGLVHKYVGWYFVFCFFKQTWLFLCGLACHPHSHNRFLGHYEKELWENSFQGDHFQKQCIRETVVFSFLVCPFLFDVILCEQRLSERLHLLQRQQINVRHKQHIYIHSPSTLRTGDGIF